MASNLLKFYVLIEQYKSYPLRLEQRVSKLSANLNLPEPLSGFFSFRLVRLPKQGVETVVDLYSRGSRIFLKVSRILYPLRSLEEFAESNSLESSSVVIPVEYSSATCEIEEPIVREIHRGSPFDLESNLKDSDADSHYFIFFTDSRDCVAKGVSNPHEDANCELWTRLISYTYGVEQLPPRRFYRRDSLVRS